MAEIDDLKAGWTTVKTEVSEAVAKFQELTKRLEDALANDAEMDSLKATVAEVASEMGATATHLDTAFGTGFQASGN